MTEREQFENLRKLATAATQGNWTACRMTHGERGDDLTPDELGEYVKNCVLAGGERPFLFLSVEVSGVSVDLCHIGNGPNGPNNAAFIQAANPATVVALLDRIQEFEQAARAASPKVPQGASRNMNKVIEYLQEGIRDATKCEEWDQDDDFARAAHYVIGLLKLPSAVSELPQGALQTINAFLFAAPRRMLIVDGKETSCFVEYDARQFAKKIAPTLPQVPDDMAIVPVDDLEAIVEVVRGMLYTAYQNAMPVCCGKPGQQCCGNPEPEWNAADMEVMDSLGPVEKRITAMLAATKEKGE